VVIRFAVALALACQLTSALGSEPAPIPTELDVAETQSELGAGHFSSRRLLTHYLERIARLDQAGPRLQSVLALNPQALAQAEELDRERQNGELRGPLHGVPMLIKDNIDTADMPTTAGARAMASHRPAKDAFIVARLRAAGALILGKTNLSEWANFRSNRSSSGWSGLGGQTRNPYDPTCNPCGSSSGTGAAIAADFAVVGIGTETDGSIMCPSGVNGLVGIKPTVGLVSRSGIIPISASQDSAGPMARSVADAATVLYVIAGTDPDDPATADADDHRVDYREGLARASLKGVRIGVLRQNFGFHDQVDALLEQRLDDLRAAGAVLIDPVVIDVPDALGDAEFEVLQYEFKDGLNRYLKQSDAPVTSLSALVRLNDDNAKQELEWFDQELLERSLSKGPLSDRAYRKARALSKRLAGAEGIDAAMKKHRLEALIAPTNGPAWKTDWVNGDHFGGGSSMLAAVAGYPSITVPAGLVHGLPVGLSFIAGAWQERRLIEIAYAFEQATRARRPPQLH
jgi:amidase